jgi:hypothetical protein
MNQSQRQKDFDEVIRLLCEDGWQKLTKDIDKCYVFAMDHCGAIFHRYLEWDSDYSEWHQAYFFYPGFWLSDRCNLYEDIDDSLHAIVVCTSMPKTTDNTRKALEILENYWNSFEMGEHNKTISIEQYQSFFEQSLQNETLKNICKDLHWMARRYADGRQSYATSLFNQHTQSLLDLGMELGPNSDGTIWARDAMGRKYDGLSEEQAASGQVHYDRINEEIKFWREKCLNLEAILVEKNQ